MKKTIYFIFKWLSAIIISLLILILIIGLIIQLPYIQNKLVPIVSNSLTEKFGTEVKVGSVSIDFLTHIQINQILVKDYKNDTMISIESLDNQHALVLELNRPFHLNEKNIVVNGVKFYLDNTSTDSVFNITRTFSKNKSKVKPEIKNESKGRSNDFISFGNILMNNVQFRLKDKFNYQTISLQVSKIDIDAKPFLISDSPWIVNHVFIYEAKAQLLQHVSPFRPKDYKPEYLHIPFVADIGKLKLVDAEFRLYDEALHLPKVKNLLTFANLDAKSINIDADNVKLRTGFFTGKINLLSASEQSGLEIQKMQADFYFSSFKTEAKNLIFKTSNSSFNGYLRFDYKHMREYLRFAEWVRVTAKMKHSNLSLKDLAFFTPALIDWKHIDVKFNTNSSGRMNDFLLTDFNGTLNKDRMKVSGNLRVMDLFNRKGLNVLAKFNQVNFEKSDIEYVFQKPNLPAEISRLGRINYQGSFKGNPIKFILNGKVNSSQGAADLAETSFDFSQKNQPKYKGKINLLDLKLDQIVSGENPIKNISAALIVDGKGFDIQSLNTYLKGNVRHISINNSNYNNVDIDGTFSDKIFTGKISSKDPTLLVDLNGKISLKQDNPNLELTIGLRDIDLKKLGYASKRLLFNANLFAIGRGKNIDEMLGSVLIKDMYILDMSQKGKRYDFSNLKLEKDIFDEGDNFLDINSDEINASIVGKYKVSEIPNLLKEYIFSYLVIDEHRKNQFISNSYFNLQLNIKNINNYTRLFYDDIKNIKSGNINLRFDGSQNKMKIKGELNHTEYLQFSIPKITINNESTRNDFMANFEFDSVYFQNKLAITPLKANILQAEEGLKLAVELLDRKDDKFVDFNAIIKKNLDEFSFHILPFSTHYGRKVWSLNPDNLVKLNLKNSSLFVQNLELNKDRQTIKISNNQNKLTSVKAQFEDVKLEELISGFMPILKSIKGDLNGDIDIANILTKPTPVANLDIKNIEFEAEKVGHLVLKSNFENNILHSNFSILGDKVKMNANGIFDANTDVDSLNLNSNIERLDIDFLNKYLKELVYEMDGNIRGKLNFYGKINEIQSEGKIYIDTLKTALNTIHTRYFAYNQVIDILPGRFVLNDFIFKDEDGNEGKADGFITHNYFKNFNLFLNAESPQLLCMNTNASHNASFYGKVYADARMQFRGMIGDRIYISSQGRNLPNSVLTIAFSNTQQTEKYGFYEFIKKGSQDIENQSYKSKLRTGGVNLDFDFKVNNFGKLFIVMDPEVDDKIECTGDGQIQFKMSPEEDMDIKGSYEINSGSYLFTYKNLVQRIFNLNRGGKMTFVGNPRSSTIDASAKFATRASAYDYITTYFGNSAENRVTNAAKSNVKVNITLNLFGKITQPEISYSLDFDQNSNPDVQSAFESIISTTKNNPAELNKQVLGLLVYQRFFPPTFTANTQGGSNNTVTSDLQNMAIDVVTGKISGYVTEWMQNTFRGMNFDLKMRNYNQQDKEAKLIDTRNELKFAVSQKLLNDRLIFNLGGNYDFGKAQNNTNNAFFGGDLDVEYLMTKQGNFRAKFYSTVSNDPLNSSYFNKTGLGFLFQKEFDEFNQLFKKQRKQ